MRAGIVILALAACSIPEKHLELDDAPGGPFECLGKPLPATANNKVTISGTVADPFAGSVLGNAAVELFQVGVGTPIFTTTSDPAGVFSHDQGTGGVPRDAYLRLTLNGYLDGYYYPPAPFVRDYDASIQLFTAANLMTIGSVGQVTIDPAKAQMLLVVQDCNGNPVGGATVTTTPAGTIRYFAASTPSTSATATDSMTGAAFIANLPVSNTTVSATVSGMTLRSHNLDTVAGTIVQTFVQP